MDSKGKTKICNGLHVKGASAGDTNNPLESSTSSGLIYLHNFKSSNSDYPYLDDDTDDDNDDDYADYVSDYGEDYSIMESQFDDVDLPPGVEASIPLFNGLAPTANVPPSTQGASTTTPVPAESKKAEFYKSFKHFDVVGDFSDHHYCNKTSSGDKAWAKQIQEEWKILEKGLPDTIFVRTYESRMDLLRAVIMGPSGTPYHDGLFVFDCFFPSKYPNEPPAVHYYSGGLRINPNLYNCGKVCLSLLGTWSGKQTEMWIPGRSTMLQVLVSIQALILNARPFFNEPGFESKYLGALGDRRSDKYNEDVFLLSLKTMVYTVRRPPKHFEDFVAGHFRNCAHDIMMACEAYKKGAKVGCVVLKDGVPDDDRMEKGNSQQFRDALEEMINLLVEAFVKL